jgi:hypothetical protein
MIRRCQDPPCGLLIGAAEAGPNGKFCRFEVRSDGSFLCDSVHATKRLMSFIAAKRQIATGVHDIIADHLQ